ncbi:hypothetical protein BC829DRAFT_420531 [Chytridium lagenaria]|nr:hypothetical protein BC829DRAFT_420531 [Chytridium lagenaria]
MSNETFEGDAATNATTNGTYANAHMIMSLVKDDFSKFLVGVAQDPMATLKELPHVLPRPFPPDPDVDFSVVHGQQDSGCCVSGSNHRCRLANRVSNKAVAVSEEVNLRAIEFSANGKAPTSSDIVVAVLKAIVTPSDQGEARRPKVAMVLSTRMISDSVVKKAAAELKELVGIRLETQEALEAELPALLAKRKEEVEKIKKTAPQVDAAVPGAAAAPAKAAEMAATPNRACFVCKEEIKGKTKQCSACKAIIYCSAECATKDWPQHKIMCPTYKKNMVRLTTEKLHDLPFPFYNSKKQLENFNQVAFLVQNEVPQCWCVPSSLPVLPAACLGEISGEIAAQQATLTTPEEKFALLGLPESMFPLGKPFKPEVDVEKIDSWEDWYKRMDCRCLLPLRRRKLTIHLLGPEHRHRPPPHRTLPLYPSPRRTPQIQLSNGSSTLVVTLNTAEYGAPHHDGSAFGTDPKTRGAPIPDLVIALNAAVFQYQSWLPTVKLLVDKGQRTVFTEPIETTVEILARNLVPIQATLAFPTRVNPFRQPVFQWKREVNLPGWSNGFITGMGDFNSSA